MKSKQLMRITAVILFAALRVSLRLAAQQSVSGTNGQIAYAQQIGSGGQGANVFIADPDGTNTQQVPLVNLAEDRIAVAVFINDPLKPQRPTDSLLRTLYGLTRAECRVALLLSDGRAPKQIADTVGVTENTVRSQIKSIYGKTGVKRQSELIRLLVNHAGPSIQRDPIR